MGLLLHHKHHVLRLPSSLFIPLPLEGDLRPCLPPGPHVDVEDVLCGSPGSLSLPRYPELFGDAGVQLLQREVQVDHVRPLLRFPSHGKRGMCSAPVREELWATPELKGREHIVSSKAESSEPAVPKKVLEDLVRVPAELIASEAARHSLCISRWYSSLQPFLAVLIIDLPFLWVGQHIVRLRDLLELLLSLLLPVSVLVWMPSHRRLLVRLLHLLLRCLLPDPQHLVVVS
mmetsp:Transcript_1839/g.5564  ORF Transcript_1839/g.5564 Transcript_1839/m.5564 type:complete len:231 (+) Transcript_1839:440-1132(+)